MNSLRTVKSYVFLLIIIFVSHMRIEIIFCNDNLLLIDISKNKNEVSQDSIII